MSTTINNFKKELERESVTTRKMLERVPYDQAEWQPHPKSMKLGALAGHIAELPGWINMTLNSTELDFAKNPYSLPPLKNGSELIEFFEKNLNDGRVGLDNATEPQLEEQWTLRNGEQVYVTLPKEEMIRTSLSQVIHHRAQLGVYLRLLNIPIPGSYGPSADESHSS